MRFVQALSTVSFFHCSFPATPPSHGSSLAIPLLHGLSLAIPLFHGLSLAIPLLHGLSLAIPLFHSSCLAIPLIHASGLGTPSFAQGCKLQGPFPEGGRRRRRRLEAKCFPLRSLPLAHLRKHTPFRGTFHSDITLLFSMRGDAMRQPSKLSLPGVVW